MNEKMEVAANGGRVRFTRDIGSVVLDLNDVESVNVKALGGADTVRVDDLSGTDVVGVNVDLGATGGGEDGQPDGVLVDATNGADVVTVDGDATGTRAAGLPALVSVAGGAPSSDRLTVNALAGDDVIDASAVAAGAMLLTLDGGDGDDVILGGPGGDTILGGPGSNIVLDSFRGTTLTSATFAGLDWLKTHVRTVDGTTALVVGGAVRTLPRADLSQLTCGSLSPLTATRAPGPVSGPGAGVTLT